MIVLDPNRHIKKAAKFAGIFAGIALVLGLAFWGFQKMKPKPAETLSAPAGEQKSNAEKQKEMIDAINKANETAEQEPLPSDEQVKRQQEMTSVVNEANKNAQQISDEEKSKRQQDMLDAINAANKR